MANHVFNEVEFRGPADQLLMAEDFFRQMEECRPQTPEGQWPHFFIQMPDRYFAYIELTPLPGSLTVSYQTDWRPNSADLMTIAAHFDLSFESSYTEHGNAYYGRCRFQPGGDLLHAWMEQEDFDKIAMDATEEYYLYGGKSFKFLGGCITEILKEKLEAMQPEKGQNRSRR